MKVAVVTPYYNESDEVLTRCMDSVANQTHKDVMHVFIADGHPNPIVAKYTQHHIVTPNCGDVGSTPRLMGCVYASANGADAIIMLDADCWMDPQHIEILLKVHEIASDAYVITHPRKLFTKDGSRFMGLCPGSDGVTFNDTNCYFITRPAFHLLSAWGFQPKSRSLHGDRPVWGAYSSSGIPMVRTNSTTVNYPSHYAEHYKYFGFPIPPDSIVIASEDGKLVKRTYQGGVL